MGKRMFSVTPTTKAKVVRADLMWNPNIAGIEFGRPLVRVTKALSWTCPLHPKVDVLEPGKCPICGFPLANTPTWHCSHCGLRRA